MKLHVGAVALVTAIVLSGCGDPRDTMLPDKVEQFEALKPKLEKLTEEERATFNAFMARTMMASAIAGKGTPEIPKITIRDAIEQQRKWVEDEKKREAEQAALKAKIEAERAAAQKAMLDAVTVTLLSKRLVQRGFDELLEVQIGYKNNTQKAIAGVRGTLDIVDIFGEELTGLRVPYDDTLAPGATGTWAGNRSVRFGLNSAKDKKFGELAPDKFKAVWKPDMIIFADGTKLAAAK